MNPESILPPSGDPTSLLQVMATEWEDTDWKALLTHSPQAWALFRYYNRHVEHPPTAQHVLLQTHGHSYHTLWEKLGSHILSLESRYGSSLALQNAIEDEQKKEDQEIMMALVQVLRHHTNRIYRQLFYAPRYAEPTTIEVHFSKSFRVAKFSTEIPVSHTKFDLLTLRWRAKYRAFSHYGSRIGREEVEPFLNYESFVAFALPSAKWRRQLQHSDSEVPPPSSLPRRGRKRKSTIESSLPNPRNTIHPLSPAERFMQNNSVGRSLLPLIRQFLLGDVSVIKR